MGEVRWTTHFLYKYDDYCRRAAGRHAARQRGDFRARLHARDGRAVRAARRRRRTPEAARPLPLSVSANNRRFPSRVNHSMYILLCLHYTREVNRSQPTTRMYRYGITFIHTA